MSACRFCGADVPKKKNSFGYYCSNFCQAREKSLKVFTKFIGDPSPQTLYDASGLIKRGIRAHLIAHAGGQCSQCGWNKKRDGATLSPLEIDHIDSNWENCDPSNLRVLCPNCHSLTDSYKGANRGKGRPHRQKKLDTP